MRQLHRLSLIVTALAGSVVAAQAAGIGPGSPAPALSVKTWYKGTPVTEFAPDKIYVVEFWATWCGPCKTSIPHLSELAKKNTDVTFMGIGIWEEDDGKNVKKFVDDMGDKMSYNVGYSGNKTGMSETWMQAAGQNGIPSSFIIKNGNIQWIGHPMEMEKPLEEIKAGTFDMAAFKVKFDKEAEDNRQAMLARTEMASVSKLLKAGKTSEAKAKLAEVEKKYPSVAAQATNLKFAILAKEDPKAWLKTADEYSKSKNESKLATLWQYAMDQTQGADGDKVNGTKAMDLAVKGSEGKDFVILFYATTFYNSTQDFKKAVATADKALALFPSTQYKDNAELKAQVEKMKADAAAKAKA